MALESSIIVTQSDSDEHTQDNTSTMQPQGSHRRVSHDGNVHELSDTSMSTEEDEQSLESELIKMDEEIDAGIETELDHENGTFAFGLDREPDLFKDLESVIKSAESEYPLPPQIPSAPKGRVRRRRVAEDAQNDQLPARVASNRELLSADELTRYLAEVRRYPLLDREEERRLAENYYHDGDRESAKRLVTGNLRLVVKIAKQYRRAWVNIMDLIQEGNIGLGEAVKRFDPYRGVRFSSFARYWIRALILQFILKNFRMVSFANTRAGRKLFFRLEKERARLQELYGEATTSQLAIALDVSEEDVETAMRLNQPVLSLDAPRYQDESDGDTLGSMLRDDVEGIDVAYEIEDFKSLVNGHISDFGRALTDEREQVIWRERLMSDEPESLAVLGERFEVTRERVRQLEQRLKKKLKAYLSENLGDEIILDLTEQQN